MSDERAYTVNDLLAASYEQKPLEFRTAFDALIVDKLTAAVDNRKVEVAQVMYQPVDDADPEPEPEQEEGADGADA